MVSLLKRSYVVLFPTDMLAVNTRDELANKRKGVHVGVSFSCQPLTKDGAASTVLTEGTNGLIPFSVCSVFTMAQAE